MVTKDKLPIYWDKFAKNNLDAIYDVIAKDSVTAARRVKKEIIKLVRGLDYFPEKFQKEIYLEDEPENYRSVSKWNNKIIYEVTDKSIIIVDIFHTSQNPSKNNKLRDKAIK